MLFEDVLELSIIYFDHFASFQCIRQPDGKDVLALHPEISI